MLPDVSIVLLTWNRAPMLEICLREMFRSLSKDLKHEIILMDNASTDESLSILERYKDLPGVTIVHNHKNIRLNAYKKLFSMARGRLIIEVDDDVLRFPNAFDKIFVDYFSVYSDYGYLALNVEQNDKTNGSKPNALCYENDVRGDMVVERGPVGGWCAAFYRSHYRLVSPLLWFSGFSMKRGEDGFLMGMTSKIFRKRHGIIKDAVCLHASGPAYSRDFGLIARDNEKYVAGGQLEIARNYS